MKNLSLLFTLFCLATVIQPSAVSANDKRSYSTHIMIMQHYVLSHSITEVYTNNILGIQSKAKTVTKPIMKKPLKQAPGKQVVSSDAMTFIMDEINSYRTSKGLGNVKTNAETCAFAQTRAQEITSSFSHDGFEKRTSAKTIPYNSWSNVAENIAMTTNYKDVVTMWKDSPGHAANMRANTPFVCVRQSGNYFAYEGMKP